MFFFYISLLVLSIVNEHWNASLRLSPYHYLKPTQLADKSSTMKVCAQTPETSGALEYLLRPRHNKIRIVFSSGPFWKVSEFTLVISVLRENACFCETILTATICTIADVNVMHTHFQSEINCPPRIVVKSYSVLSRPTMFIVQERIRVSVDGQCWHTS